MKKTLLTILGVVAVSGLLIAATQKVEVNRHYEFGPFYAVDSATGTMYFVLPQELKSVVVTVCSLNTTSAVDVARAPLEVTYKGIYRSYTNTVDLWYPSGLLTGSAGTNTLFVPNIKDGILIKGSRSLAGGTNSAFRIAIDAVTLQ